MQRFVYEFVRERTISFPDILAVFQRPQGLWQLTNIFPDLFSLLSKQKNNMEMGAYPSSLLLDRKFGYEN